MRAISLLMVVFLLVAFVAGCPALRPFSPGGGDRSGGPAAPESWDVSSSKLREEKSVKTDQSSEGVSDSALAQAAAEDVPILEAILEYVHGQGAKEEVRRLAEAVWIPYATAQEMQEFSDRAVVYRISTGGEESEGWFVEVGPPNSEFFYEFAVIERPGGGYELVEWHYLPDPGEDI
ncbi:MAG: hypothetical protein ACUVX8_11115 [Candidatus Zipacnadales bacterium]